MAKRQLQVELVRPGVFTGTTAHTGFDLRIVEL